MKKIYFLLLALLVVTTSCSNLSDLNIKAIAYDEAYEMGVNTISKTVDNRFTVKFDSVMNDSRCPKDVVCVWEGVASVRFTISENGHQNTVELHTLNSGTWTDNATINGVNIKLLALNPYPESTVKPNYKKYKATILLSKIN